MNQTNPAGGTLLLVNKKSCLRPDLAEAVGHARSSGVDLTVSVPWDAADLLDFVAGARDAGFARVIAGGGDGTINMVSDAILQNGDNDALTLGILPLGTANDFARGVGIPADDLPAALMTACSGAPTRIDLGLMNGRHFVNVASGGLGAEITAATAPEAKKLLGGIAYTLAGLANLHRLEPYAGRVIFADGTVAEGRVVVMAVGNARFAGGGFEVAPEADPTDGLLDLAAIVDPAPSMLARLASEIRDPQNESNIHLVYRQLDRFTIETERPFSINLDGEPVTGTRFDFEIVPQCLSVVLG